MNFEYMDPQLDLMKDDRGKIEARENYQQNLPKGYAVYEPSAFVAMHHWLALSVTFQLQAPWFSKDDRPFHVLDNPVHRDHVFCKPFIPASSWKGLVRWAARMQTGLLTHLEASNNKELDRKDSAELIHLFGNERDADENFQRGALAFRPTWFENVAFEVINPHGRATKAGKNPILYEVVPPKTNGELRLLYAPLPGIEMRDVKHVDAMLLVLDAIESLLTEYGFSAKRTSGWGVASITKASLQWRDGSRGGKMDELRRAVKDVLGGGS